MCMKIYIMQITHTYQGIARDIWEKLDTCYTVSDHPLKRILQENEGDDFTLLEVLLREALDLKVKKPVVCMRPIYKYEYIFGPDEDFVINAVKDLNTAAHVLSRIASVQFKHSPGESDLTISLQLV